jgi:hypothetical protein
MPMVGENLRLTDKQLAAIPWRLRWAFAARCARRVLGLTAKTWPPMESDIPESVLLAVKFAENPRSFVGPCESPSELVYTIASRAHLTAFALCDPVRQAACEAAANAAAVLTTGDNMPYILAAVSFAHYALTSSEIPAVQAFPNPHWQDRRSLVGDAPALLDGMIMDYEKLIAAIQDRKWDHMSEVLPDFFDPLPKPTPAPVP